MLDYEKLLEEMQQKERSKFVKDIEQKFNSIFVGNFALKSKIGWTPFYAYILYCKEFDTYKNQSEYLGIYYDSYKEVSCICNADWIKEKTYTAITDGKIATYSRSVHDYRSLENGNVSIDGGNEYVRVIGDKPWELFKFKIKEGKFVYAAE